MNVRELRAKRIAAGVPGELVAAKTKIERGRLSRIERGIVTASPEELERVRAAIEELAEAKQQIEEFAVSKGWTAAVAV